MELYSGMLLVAALLAAAQPEPPRIGIFGIGNESCAHAFTARDEAFAWTMGYFSGRNEERRALVGGTSDGWGVFAEIERLCLAQPSRRLRDVAAQVYVQMAVERR